MSNPLPPCLPNLRISPSVMITRRLGPTTESTSLRFGTQGLVI